MYVSGERRVGHRIRCEPVASADRPSFEDWFFAQKLRRPDLSESGFPVQNHRCGTVPESHRTSLMFLQHPYWGAEAKVARLMGATGNVGLGDQIDDALDAFNQVVVAQSK